MARAWFSVRWVAITGRNARRDVVRTQGAEAGAAAKRVCSAVQRASAGAAVAAPQTALKVQHTAQKRRPGERLIKGCTQQNNTE